jgi:FMN-dependent oxidoreductase (nitrilotriacetate monooxygenase family)
MGGTDNRSSPMAAKPSKTSAKPPRQMTLVGFLQAQNCSNYVGSWRHPATAPDFLNAAYYQRIGRTLEAGCFDLAFFDDRLAMPDILGDDHRASVENGVRVVKMDAATILTVMGMATEKLGLGSTYSTTYYEPFHVARVFQTMDLMLNGRVAWNVVTSLNHSEARNFSQMEHPEHDLRYDKADEFMEVVLGHWDSWAPDAIEANRETGRFADPDKVTRLNHEGRWFRSRGPFTVPRSPQGRPVIIQAGQSGRGQLFASRWAVYHNLAAGQKTYASFKASVAKAGRDPDLVRVAPAVYVIPGETQAMAEDKMALIDKLAKPIDGMALLSEVLNFDFASKGYDDAFNDDELKSISGLRATLDRVVAVSGKQNPTVRDFVEFSKRGTIHEFPTFCGSPKQVADQMEQWFVERGCDGFVIAGTHLPGSYEDFTRLVVPELQKRGLFRKAYTGNTLRDHLGLKKAEIGDWKSAV